MCDCVMVCFIGIFVFFFSLIVRDKRSLNEVIRVVGIGLKSLGFLLHAFLDFQDGRRLRLILQGTKNRVALLTTIRPFSIVI